MDEDEDNDEGAGEDGDEKACREAGKGGKTREGRRAGGRGAVAGAGAAQNWMGLGVSQDRETDYVRVWG